MSTPISIRLPDKTVNELDTLARKLERTKTFLIRKAIDTYLEEYADYLLSMDRLLDKDDHVVDGDTLRDALGL